MWNEIYGLHQLQLKLAPHRRSQKWPFFSLLFRRLHRMRKNFLIKIIFNLFCWLLFVIHTKYWIEMCSGTEGWLKTTSVHSFFLSMRCHQVLRFLSSFVPQKFSSSLMSHFILVHFRYFCYYYFIYILSRVDREINFWKCNKIVLYAIIMGNGMENGCHFFIQLYLAYKVANGKYWECKWFK